MSQNIQGLRSWAPVIGLTLSAFIFNTSEFIPIGLLTDIARDFQITEAQAGLIITVYAWIVTVLSLPLMLLASKMEYKKLLLSILTIFVVSHILSGIATGFYTLMASRAGVAFSHAIFWSIATPVAVRIAPQGKKALALSMVVTGTSIAMIAGLPLGRIIGLWLGWRATFISIGIAAFVIGGFLMYFFPKVPNRDAISLKSLPAMLKNRALIGVYVCCALMFCAHYTGYSFIEPFMAQVAKMPETGITWALTVFGVAGLVSSFLFSRYFDKVPIVFYLAATFGVGAFLSLLKFSAQSIDGVMLLCVFWGIMFTFFALVFQATVIHLVPHGAPIAMSIFSGIANVGIGSGALVGGFTVTHFSIASIGYAGAIFAFIAGVICLFLIRDFLRTDED